jgi:hypothetical protein
VNGELPQPDRDRLSILVALVLLAYSLIRIVALPSAAIQYTIFGLLVRFEINTSTVMIAFAALLTISGADWVIRSHPAVQTTRAGMEHWVLPGLAALGIGAIVIRLPAGAILAGGLVVAAVLFAVVIIGEFISADRSDPRFPVANFGLRILSYVLLGGTLFAIIATGERAIFAVPMVMLASVGVSWRVLRLGGRDRPLMGFALFIGWAIAQLGWALHYWPLLPIKGALILTMAAYLGTELVEGHLGEGIGLERGLELVTIGGIAFIAILAMT